MYNRAIASFNNNNNDSSCDSVKKQFIKTYSPTNRVENFEGKKIPPQHGG